MIIVIGGGPAGFFAAITAREVRPDRPVVLLEKQGNVLRKVAVSGGGRCNVTHACPSARDLAAHYPRGGRELIGPFTRWSVDDTVAWFAERGVELKTEPDGRMFPVTDASATIVDCLRRAATTAGVEVRTQQAVLGVEALTGGGFRVDLADGQALECEAVLLASGGHARTTESGRAADGYTLAQSLGHTLVQPVPSLFTFNLTDRSWAEMAGLVVDPVAVRARGAGLPGKGLAMAGPLLITHWGVSGPAVLKLSAWGARQFHESDYRFDLAIDWLPAVDAAALDSLLQEWADANPRKTVAASCPRTLSLPRRLWETLAARAEIPGDRKWAELGRKPRHRLGGLIKNTELKVDGKSTNKEEFVTCGGIPLAEVDFKTMASRLCPGLYLAGEVLGIDGVTGGFNFQAAWTTGRLAGLGLAGEPG